jgi:hypothetical protein
MSGFSPSVIVAAITLWLDILFSTIIGANAENVAVYKTFGILTTLVSPPLPPSPCSLCNPHLATAHGTLARSRMVRRPP